MAKKNRINVCAVIETAMILIGIIYIIVCTILGVHNQWAYRLVFAGWVAIYMIISDFVEPVMTNRFRRKNKRQIRAYYIYAILDVIGMAGLLWFVVMAGIFDDFTHYAGIAIFVVCFVPKNTFYKKFNVRRSYFEEVDAEEEDFEFDILDD